MKRNYLFFGFAVLLLLFTSVQSYAEVYSGSCGENVNWTLDTETGLLEISGNGEMEDFNYSDLRPWLSHNSFIKKCTIMSGVTRIGSYAFDGCTELTSIIIPKGMISIGINAFNGCTRLKSVHISDLAAWCNISFEGYTFGSISANPLNYAKHLYLNEEEIKNLIIPNGVTQIKDNTFNGYTGLTSVTFPNSVTTIGKSAFYGCTELTHITISNNETMIGYDAFYNTHWYNNQPDGVIYLGTHCYKYKGEMPQNTAINIKEGTTTIASCAFVSCTRLTNISIPKSITNIGYGAFNGCKELTSFTIPNSVITIGDLAFSGCNNLKTVINLSNLNITEGSTSNGYVAYYANKVINADAQAEDFFFIETEEGNILCDYIGCNSILTLPLDYKGGKYRIGDNVFKHCNELTSITIPESVTSIGSSAFEGCTGLTSITIPESVTSIGSSAFYGCTGLTSVTIGNSVTSIGSSAFFGCTGLTSVTIGNSVTSIGDGAFLFCTGLTSVTIGNSVTSIGEYTFSYCTGLTSITIPNSVTSIGDGAFSDCTGLTSITIPESVTSIGDGAFYGCTGLTSVHITDIAAWCNISFDGASSNPLSYAEHLYLNGKEIKDLVIPDDVTTIRDYAFYNCTGLTSITIPNSVTTIGVSAFYDCTGLTSITIPNSVTTIGDNAFYNCTGLTSITIPNSVTTIGNKAFNGCNNLKTIFNFSDLNITKGSTSNGYIAYYANKVVNADSQIGDFFFIESSEGNTLSGYIGNESNLTLPEDYKGGNYSIGESAFDGCANLTSLTIGSKITNIRSNAFAGCTALNSIIWNAKDYPDLASAEEMPFKDSQITSITFGENVTSIPKYFCSGMTNLKTVTFPQSLTSIRHYAFDGCTGLTEITLPENVNRIGPSAFAGCSNIKTIYCRSQEPPVCGNSALDGIDTWDCTLFVPEGAEALYKAADQWKEFFFIEEITGIDTPRADDGKDTTYDIYDMSGRTVRKAATTTDGLKAGLYIINGRKVLVE